jgi:predicted DNA-binding protein
MDTNTNIEPAMLVNFRAPKSVIETLDQLSKFHHRTRTSILLDLINSWINEKTCDIPLKVRQLKDLKSALNSHEQSAFGNRRSVGTSLIGKTPRNGSERIPTSFYSTSMSNFDDGDDSRGF